MSADLLMFGSIAGVLAVALLVSDQAVKPLIMEVVSCSAFVATVTLVGRNTLMIKSDCNIFGRWLIGFKFLFQINFENNICFKVC